MSLSFGYETWSVGRIEFIPFGCMSNVFDYTMTPRYCVGLLTHQKNAREHSLLLTIYEMCVYSWHEHIRPFHTYVCPPSVFWQEPVDTSQTLTVSSRFSLVNPTILTSSLQNSEDWQKLDFVLTSEDCVRTDSLTCTCVSSLGNWCHVELLETTTRLKLARLCCKNYWNSEHSVYILYF